jgi:hypothetical protein
MSLTLPAYHRRYGSGSDTSGFGYRPTSCKMDRGSGTATTTFVSQAVVESSTKIARWAVVRSLEQISRWANLNSVNEIVRSVPEVGKKAVRGLQVGCLEPLVKPLIHAG